MLIFDLGLYLMLFFGNYCHLSQSWKGASRGELCESSLKELAPLRLLQGSEVLTPPFYYCLPAYYELPLSWLLLVGLY